MFYIGGDTQTYEFDFFTKVNNSVVECPLNAYFSYSKSASLTSNDINGDWRTGYAAFNGQNYYDQLKSKGGANLLISTGNVKSGLPTDYDGRYATVLIEVDLTNICNSVFGGSNAGMRSCLKAIKADVHACGSGVKDTIVANGMKVAFYYADGWGSGSIPGTNGAASSASSVTQISIVDSRYSLLNQATTTPLNASNKIYLLLSSIYPCSGNNSSLLNIDYINIKIDFARIPDTVQQLDVNLSSSDDWTLVLKGIAPINLLDNVKEEVLAVLYSDSSNYVYIERTGNANSTTVLKNGIVFGMKKRGLFNSGDSPLTPYTGINNIALSNSNYKLMQIALKKSGRKLTAYMLQDGAIKSASINYGEDIISGNLKLMIGNINNTLHANAYMDNVYFFKRTYTDDEIESILKGTPATLKYKVTKINKTWSAYDSTAGMFFNYADVQLDRPMILNKLDNLQFTFAGDTKSYSVSEIKSVNNVIIIAPGSDELSTDMVNKTIMTATTSDGLIKIDTDMINIAKRYEAVNLVPQFQNWNLNSAASISEKTLTLNATAAYQVSSVDVSVLPNNKYEIKGNITQSTSYGYIQVSEFYNNIELVKNRAVIYSNGSPSISPVFTTGSKTNRLRITVGSNVAGTFTFTDISLKLSN